MDGDTKGAALRVGRRRGAGPSFLPPASGWNHPSRLGPRESRVNDEAAGAPDIFGGCGMKDSLFLFYSCCEAPPGRTATPLPGPVAGRGAPESPAGPKRENPLVPGTGRR